MRAALVLGGVLAVLLLATTTAEAGDADEARAAMRRGAAALERGDAEVALREYEQAKVLVPKANAPHFFAGAALSMLGRWREAVESFETYLAKDPTVSDAAQVRERIARIRASHFPARVNVVTDFDATITIDGSDQTTKGPFELGPGKHRIAVQAPGRKPASQEVDLTGDSETTVTILLIAAPPPPSPAMRSLPSETETRESALPWRTVGWIGAGVGGAGLLMTMIVDAAALGPKVEESERVRAAAANGTLADSAHARDVLDDAESLRMGVLLGYGVSGAVLLGGLAVGLFGPKTTKPTRSALAPVVGPGFTGLRGQF